jgi:hypothetical protein
VLRITGSKSEIVHEALPVDDPQVRQPDITRAQQLLGWGGPEIQLERRPEAHACRASDGSRSLRKRFGVFAAIFFLAAALSARRAGRSGTCSSACRTMRSVLSGNPTFTFNTLKQLRVQIVRVNLNWNQVAKRRPAHSAGPVRPGLRLGRLRSRRPLRRGQHGMQLLLTSCSCRRGRTAASRATSHRRLQRPAQLRYAAATRYSGHYIRTRTDSTRRSPAREVLLAWNEPKQPELVQQTSGGRFVSPQSYAKICTAIWQGVHFTNFSGEKVACGATGALAGTTRRAPLGPRCRRLPS